jgi:hypothetical protein
MNNVDDGKLTNGCKVASLGDKTKCIQDDDCLLPKDLSKLAPGSRQEEC